MPRNKLVENLDNIINNYYYDAHSLQFGNFIKTAMHAKEENEDTRD